MVKTTNLGVASALGVAMLLATPASALSLKECSVKYQAAKKANTLGTQKWNEFRAAQCGDDDASETEASSLVKDTPAAAPARAGVKPKAAVFPKAVSTKYSTEAPGKARLKTCADQYNANKAGGGNAELKWIERGGGYWSQCNAKLKSV